MLCSSRVDRLIPSIASIYRRLSIIPFHDPSASSPTPIRFSQHPPSSEPIDSVQFATSTKASSLDPPLLITYNIWKPASPFKKSAVPTPDFRIVVLDARDSSFPSLTQLSNLMDDLPHDPPPERMQNNTYQKLKHGYKSVILGIVDQGIVSYLRIADAAFGKTRVWERSMRGSRGGKGVFGTGSRGRRGGAANVEVGAGRGAGCGGRGKGNRR